MAKLVSRTYGDALFELAVEENRTDSFMEEIPFDYLEFHVIEEDSLW